MMTKNKKESSLYTLYTIYMLNLQYLQCSKPSSHGENRETIKQNRKAEY